MCALGLVPGQYSESQHALKGIEATLAAARWKRAEAMPSLEAGAKAATIIKQEHSLAMHPKQREFGGKSLF